MLIISCVNISCTQFKTIVLTIPLKKNTIANAFIRSMQNGVAKTQDLLIFVILFKHMHEL